MDRFIYAGNVAQHFAGDQGRQPQQQQQQSHLYPSSQAEPVAPSEACDGREATNARANNGGGATAYSTSGGNGPSLGGVNASASTAAMRIPTATNSIFGCYGEDPFIQQARAVAALSEMDVKGMTASVFNYHPGAAMMDFEAASSMGIHLHQQELSGRGQQSGTGTNFQAEMAASLQQQMMQQMASMSMQQQAAMHYAQHPLYQHPTAAAASVVGQMGMHGIGGSTAVAAALPAFGGQQHPQQQHLQQQQHQSAAQLGAISSSSLSHSMLPGLSSLATPSGKQSTAQQRYPALHSAHLAAEVDTDPRELERFAEHFKQRRIKLGVTQADVGKALAYLKMPGVGSLSQSTICRFESLTLSHNNMVALKPILQSWLEKAEEATKSAAGKEGEEAALHCAGGILPCVEKKRKRTSIAAPEKRQLEQFFQQQSRPTGDRISFIAEKLDLKKNVVRVWFCNQRQKQKRKQFRDNRGGQSGTQSQQPQPQNGVQQNNSQSSVPQVLGPLSSSAAAATLMAAAVQAAATQQRAGQHCFPNDAYGNSGGMAENGTCDEEDAQRQRTEKGQQHQMMVTNGVIRHNFGGGERRTKIEASNVGLIPPSLFYHSSGENGEN